MVSIAADQALPGAQVTIEIKLRGRTGKVTCLSSTATIEGVSDGYATARYTEDALFGGLRVKLKVR